MNELSTNPYFWAGQVGLLAVVAYGIAVIEATRSQAPRWHTIPLIFFTGMALYNIGHPAFGSGSPLPVSGYLLRLGAGAAMMAGYYYIKRSQNGFTQPVARMLNRVLLISLIVGGLGLAVVGLTLRVQEQNQLIREQKAESKQQAEAVIDAIQADTAQKARLRADLDSTNALLRTQRAATEQAKREREALKRKTDAIKHDTELLKNEIGRKAKLTPAPLKPIDTVQHEQPKKKGFFRRLFGAVKPDSTNTVARYE